MARKAIPISLARSRKTQTKNYHAPTKPDGDKEPAIVVAPKIPKAPKDRHQRNILSFEGMREWRRITGLLKNAMIVGEVDRALLTQYCVLWEQLIVDRENFKAAQHTQLRLCAVELGLTPSARARFRN